VVDFLFVMFHFYVFFSQMQMKLKALGYFVLEFEAHPAEEYLRRTGY
jgi:hypothetical protein